MVLSGWPSHLDHLLLSNEVFDDFASPSTVVECLDIASFIPGGWSEFDTSVSDTGGIANAIPWMYNRCSPQTHSSCAHRCHRTRVPVCSGRLLLYHFDDGSVLKHVSLSAQPPCGYSVAREALGAFNEPSSCPPRVSGGRLVLAQTRICASGPRSLVEPEDVVIGISGFAGEGPEPEVVELQLAVVLYTR